MAMFSARMPLLMMKSRRISLAANRCDKWNIYFVIFVSAFMNYFIGIVAISDGNSASIIFPNYDLVLLFISDPVYWGVRCSLSGKLLFGIQRGPLQEVTIPSRLFIYI